MSEGTMALPSNNQSRPEPPATLIVKAAGIPAELKARAQFVGWQWEWRTDLWSKPPIEAKRPERRAKSNSSATWATFAAAWDAFHVGDVQGIGVVITADDPYTFIDLGKCLNPETCELAEIAAAIVDLYPGSYIERSVTGTG